MAVKIPNLPSGITLTGTDLVVVDTGSATYKTTVADLAQAIINAVAPVPVSSGGTGATDAAGARTNLGVDAALIDYIYIGADGKFYQNN